MSSHVASVLIPVLLLLPGYALLPGDCPRRLRLPFTVFSSFVVTSVLGLCLMMFGHFSVPLLAALEAPFLLIRARTRHWPGLELKGHLPIIFLSVLIVVFLLLTAGEPFDATGDAGVYTISAVHLSETGRWTWPLEEVIPAGVPENLVTYEPPYVRPWLEVAPGFIVRGRQVSPQFFPLFPLWGAIFGASIGIRGVLAANLLGGLMMALGYDALFRLLLGRAWRFVGLAFIFLNPVFLVFLKYPSAEVFLAGILAGWLLWMVLFLRAPTARAAMLPAALLALAVLTKFFAWAVAGAVLIVVVFLPWRYIRSGVTFVLMMAPSFVFGGWLAAPHLENHFGQLMLLSSFKIIVIGCGGLLIVRLLWSRLTWVIQRGLAVLYGAALVFLWVSSRATHLRDFAALSGSLVVWGAAVGLCLYLWRRRSTWLVFPAFIFVLLSLYLFLGSGDSPYYPFAARRYLPVTVPLGGFFIAYLARRSPRYLSRLILVPQRATTTIIGFIVAIAVFTPLWIQRTAVLVRQGDGFLDTLAELEHAIPRDQVVLAVGQAWRYSPHLLLRGRPVYCLDLRSRGVLERLDRFLRDHPDTQVLTSERHESGALRIIDEKRQVIQVTTTPPLTAGPPRGVRFQLFPTGNRELTVPEQLDIGTSDLLRVTGCYGSEEAKERSFRWTGASAAVLVGPGKQVRFVWSRGGNPHKPLVVRIFASGTHIGDASLDKGWHTSRWFDIPVGTNPVVIEIRSPTFQPARHGGGRDHRNLGICLDLVEVR